MDAQVRNSTEQPPVVGQTTEPEAQDEQPRYSRREVIFTMLGVILVTFLASMDQTIMGTAMPRIISELNGFDRYTWVTTAYLLTETITIPIYGKLSDLFGRKRIFLFGIILFLGGSALSGTSATFDQLIFFRALQGLGSGALLPISVAVVGDLFTPRQRGKWQGITGSMYGLSSIIGPALGGWITDHFSWRWVFYVNLPLGLTTLAVLFFLMPMLRQSKRRTTIDYGGAALLVASTVPLLLALTWAGTEYAWLSPQILGLCAVALVAVVALILYETRLERRGGEPIIAPGLFIGSARIFGVGVLVSAIVGMGIFSCGLFIPLFLQGVVGTSVTNSGLTLTPLMLSAIIGAVLSGQAISRSGRYKWVTLTGQTLAILGTLLLVRLDVYSTQTDVVVAMAVLGLGVGSGLTVYTTAVQNALPQRKGQASSALVFFRTVGGTIGLAVMGSVLNTTYWPAFQSALPTGLAQRLPAKSLDLFHNPQVLLSPETLARVRQGAQAQGPQAVATLHTLLDAVKSALAQSLHTVFFLSLVIMIVGLLTIFFLKEIPLRDRKDLTSTGS